MYLPNVLPIIAVGAAVLFMLLRLNTGRHAPRRHAWLIPATFSLLFFGLSTAAIITEGPVGFWTEHTRNLWGNQIWIDLLLAVCIGWYFAAPQASALGMRMPFWLVFIVCTGCIGFSAMIARILYLRENSLPVHSLSAA
jgi:hypothetical protein